MHILIATRVSLRKMKEDNRQNFINKFVVSYNSTTYDNFKEEQSQPLHNIYACVQRNRDSSVYQ